MLLSNETETSLSSPDVRVHSQTRSVPDDFDSDTFVICTFNLLFYSVSIISRSHMSNSYRDVELE